VVRLACDLMAAARAGVEQVYRVLDRGLRASCAAVDGVTVWELDADRFACVFAGGARYEHFAGAAVSAFAAASVLAEARRTGLHQFVGEGLAPLHPADRFAVAIPLGEAPFVVYVALGARPNAPETANALDVCALAAQALAVAKDRAEDHMRARYDGLTGLLGPRAFRTELARRLREAPRSRVVPRLALLFLDTDRFKEWNDRRGHAAGDDLLRRLAAMLRAHARGPEDLVARNGGDEFCIVWSDCEKSDAIARAEALRAAIAAAFAAEPIPITASIGVGAYPVDAQTPEGLLEAADAAMYDAKRSGRNRVSYLQGRIREGWP
jgi:diguanylate cyclase (GGDEF)-like protein